MAITITNVRPLPPAASGGTGSITYDVSGAGTYDLSLLFAATGAVAYSATGAPGPVANLVATGLAPGLYHFVLVDYGTGVGSGFDATVPAYAAPVVALDATPPALTAAHIPALLLVRASPRYVGFVLTPAAVLLCLDVADGAGWREIAAMRQVCDAALGTARFDLSEYLKGGFAQTPPDETGGNDAALAFRYRVRAGNAATGYTGAPGTEAVSFAALAVNAAQVVNPAAAALPLALGPGLPYASVPTGYARFRSTVSAGATGIRNLDTLPETPADWPCPVRQFVWLDVSGAWVWGFFAGRHEHGTETGDGLTVRRAGGVERYLSRGDVRRTLRVYSDKLDAPTFDVLVGIRDSVQVFERLASGQYVPVVVEPGSFADYQETAKLFTVDFLARYPVLARQTQ